MPCPRSLRANAILAPGDDYFCAVWTLPPCSLHPFWPLQALLALLQPPWPLHSLMPSHITDLLAFFASFSFANAAPDKNSEATAEARTAFFIDMVSSQEVDSAGEYAHRRNPLRGNRAPYSTHAAS